MYLNTTKKEFFPYILILFIILTLNLLSTISFSYLFSDFETSFNLPLILSVSKTIISLTVFSIMYIHNRKEEYNKLTIVFSIKLMFGFTVLYFLSIYLFKFNTINNIIEITYNKIINGNPSLIMDFTTYNYRFLNLVASLMGGLSSGIIILFEIIILQFLIHKINSIAVIEENLILYDNFLFDKKIIFYSLISFILSFLSINQYIVPSMILSVISSIISIIVFILSSAILYFVLMIHTKKDIPIQRSLFYDSNKNILILSIAMVFLLISLIIFILILYFLYNIKIENIFILTTNVILILFTIISTIKIRKLDNN